MDQQPSGLAELIADERTEDITFIYTAVVRVDHGDSTGGGFCSPVVRRDRDLERLIADVAAPVDRFEEWGS